MNACSQTISKEVQLFSSLLQNIICKEVAVGSSYNFSKYQLTVQEFFPLRTDQNVFFPLKSLILQQLPENDSSHTLPNDSNKYSVFENPDSTIEWTGCPLETSYEQLSNENLSDTFNTTPTNMKQTRLPLTKARSFLSSYNICFGGKKNSNIVPLWIPCDVNNSEHISWIGAYCTEDMNSRAIITSSGLLTGKSLPSLDDVKKKHFLGPIADFQKTEIEVFASYKFADNVDTVERLFHQPDCVHGIPVTILCFSNRPTQILNILDEDAKFNILLKVNSDSDKNSQFMMCRDLELIKMLISGTDNAEAVWPPKLTDYDIHSEIQSLLEGLKYRSFQKMSNKDLGNVTSCEMESSALRTRQELDFTDELWNVLKKCSSYEELQDNLDFVMEVLRTGEVQPVIFRNNSTHIGKVVKSSQGGSEADLKGNSLFKILIDIGLEKLRRDFMYIFVENELATQSQLCPFLKSGLSFTKSVLQMTKLHNVLKIVSTCETSLKLPIATVKLFARKALTIYSEMESDIADHTFNFPVPYASIGKLINSLKPSKWQISFKTTTPTYVSSTLCCLSRSNIPSDQCHKDTDLPNSPLMNSYCCTQVQFIQDFIYHSNTDVK